MSGAPLYSQYDGWEWWMLLKGDGTRYYWKGEKDVPVEEGKEMLESKGMMGTGWGTRGEERVEIPSCNLKCTQIPFTHWSYIKSFLMLSGQGAEVPEWSPPWQQGLQHDDPE